MKCSAVLHPEHLDGAPIRNCLKDADGSICSTSLDRTNQSPVDLMGPNVETVGEYTILKQRGVAQHKL